MRGVAYFLAGGLMLGAGGAMAQEFDKQCAWGLANGKKVATDCKFNFVDENGKTYCFSSNQVMYQYMGDREGNRAKAEAAFKKK
ncbi:MAG: hypothetical protein KIS79_05135 [Burkholderiales bacterium]|nr:hypothetical protein [Burkholderiales bacterium]